MTPSNGQSQSTQFVAESLVGHMFAERYRIDALLGQGGMGVVYKAEHTLMNKPMAIKMVLPSVMTNERAFRRFQQEARAASSLSHPNIVTVHDFGVTLEGQAYLVMDFIDGRSLEDILHDQFTLSATRCLNLFSQACDALGHAHKKNVIHRDIKASNVMVLLDEDGSEIIKIVDFGLAKVLTADEDQHLTKSGAIVGSPLYMSPEQCRGVAIDNRTDIYALGCLLYKCLTGTVPFQGATVMDTVYQHMTEPPIPPKTLNSDADVTTDLERLILKSLQKNPDHRQQTMAELKQELMVAIPAKSATVMKTIPTAQPETTAQAETPDQAGTPGQAGSNDAAGTAAEAATTAVPTASAGGTTSESSTVAHAPSRDSSGVATKSAPNRARTPQQKKSKTGNQIRGGIIFGATVTFLSCLVSFLSVLLIIKSGVIGTGQLNKPASAPNNETSATAGATSNPTEERSDGLQTPVIAPVISRASTLTKVTGTGQKIRTRKQEISPIHDTGREDARLALSHRMKADTLYDEQNYQAAEAEYIMSLKEEQNLLGDSDVQLIPTLVNLIDCYLKLDKGSDAGEYVNQAARIYDKNQAAFPQNPKYLEAIGIGCVKNRNWEGGLTFLEKSIELNGQKVHANALVALGHAYLETGQKEKALIVLRKAVALSQGKPSHKSAVKLYERALKANGKTDER